MIILSHYQTRPLWAAKKKGAETAVISLDLNITTTEIGLSQDAVLLPDGQMLAWDLVAEINDNELSCYQVQDNEIEKIQFFSETFNRYYSLMPTQAAPTMLISGIPMHRIKDTDPHKDTLSKIKAILPATGEILDTTMGLGYTATEAAKTANHVTTIELDPAVVEVCRCNPWSQALFDNPKITRKIGHAWDVVEELEAERFTRIIHDPPMFSLAGELYSADFYRELLRVLKGNGRLFHYIGDPNSKSGGGVTKGVVRRLKEVGFSRVKPYPEAFGVVAYV
ncbi:MAG: spermine synthase [Anaerolineae bacterium]|nr:spermine synthase [Anaerolineae bacterium]